MWVDSLAIEQPDGSTLRHTITLSDALEAMCPFTEVVRLGLFVMPLRGPSRFFGGDDAVLAMVRQCVLDVVGAEAKLGVAEGLFCAELAAHREVLVPRGASDAFRRAQPLEVLGRKDLATTCQRLGLHTLGAFADLEPARVAERFNQHALVLHRVARGELTELESQRDRRLARRLAQLRGETDLFEEQQGFFGQRGAEDDRAEAAARRVRHRLGAGSHCGGEPARGSRARGSRHPRALGLAGDGRARPRAVARTTRGTLAGDHLVSSGSAATTRRGESTGGA